MCACQHTFKSQSCWLTLNPHFFLLKENACCYFLIMFTVQIPMAVAKKSRYNISQLNCAQHINIYNYIYIIILNYTYTVYIPILHKFSYRHTSALGPRPGSAGSSSPPPALPRPRSAPRTAGRDLRPWLRGRWPGLPASPGATKWSPSKWGGLNSPRMGYNIVRNIIYKVCNRYICIYRYIHTHIYVCVCVRIFVCRASPERLTYGYGGSPHESQLPQLVSFCGVSFPGKNGIIRGSGDFIN